MGSNRLNHLPTVQLDPVCRINRTEHGTPLPRSIGASSFRAGHADFQSRAGSPEALYLIELPGRPLPNLHDNALTKSPGLIRIIGAGLYAGSVAFPVPKKDPAAFVLVGFRLTLLNKSFNLREPVCHHANR